MTIETISIFTISLILLWIKPGPGQALKITRALNDGFMASFYIVWGIITACILFFLIAALGLSIITNFFSQTSAIFKVMGGFYLLYLGYSGLKNIRKGLWKGRIDTSHKKKFIENYSLGLFLTLANPLPIFYFLGIMPTLVPIGTFTPSDIFIGIGIIIFVGLTVDTSLLFLVSQTKDVLSNTKFVKRINLFTSIGFLLIGLFFFYSACCMSNFSYDFF